MFLKTSFHKGDPNWQKMGYEIYLQNFSKSTLFSINYFTFEKIKQKCLVRRRYTSVLQTDPKRGMRCTFKIDTGRHDSVFIMLYWEKLI